MVRRDYEKAWEVEVIVVQYLLYFFVMIVSSSPEKRKLEVTGLCEMGC